jgi:two-component system, chemotaxis family, chemotaxis protein CheY
MGCGTGGHADEALVVDDSRVMRGMVIQALLRTGLADFEFTEAGDGDEALEKFNPRHTDIMFVDWNMPHVSGIDFVRKVRAAGNTGHIPIVMVTGEKTIGKMEEALDQAGADEYVTKPFTIDVLRRKLRPLIERVQASHSSQPRGFFSKLIGTGG